MINKVKTLASFLKQQLDMPESLIQQVIGFYREEQIPKNHFVAQKGQYCQKLCFLREGFLRFYSYSDQKTVTHWIFGKGQLVTDVASFYLGEPAKWQIQALSDTVIQGINIEDYQRMRTAIPEWDIYEKRLLVKLMSALENRVYAFLSMSAEERFQYLFRSDPEMFNELPLHYLASMLGMTPETLSRIRRKSIS